MPRRTRRGDQSAASHRGVVTLAARRRQRHTACLDLAEADPQRAADHRVPSSLRKRRGSARARNDVWRNSTSRARPAGRSLDRVDHRDAARGHPPVQVVDVEHPRRQVIDVGGRTPAMSAATADTRDQLVIPGLRRSVHATARTPPRPRDKVIGLGRRRAPSAAITRARSINAGSNSWRLPETSVHERAGRRRRNAGS